MEENLNLLQEFTQHPQLLVRISSDKFGQLPETTKDRFRSAHRKAHFFLMFIVKGHAEHIVDLEKISLTDNQVLFVLPNQIHRLPATTVLQQHYKLSFDSHCLSLLPKKYPFFVNPLHSQVMQTDPAATLRITRIFDTLIELLGERGTPAALILTHMDSLLTELNHAYFQGNDSHANSRDKLTKYTAFRELIEKELYNNPAIEDIARQLSISTSALYTLVKFYSGASPKDYIQQRLILEAQRKLYYGESSVKEIAFDLGFNDPDYFSRLFKKITGKTVTASIASFGE